MYVQVYKACRDIVSYGIDNFNLFGYFPVSDSNDLLIKKKCFPFYDSLIDNEFTVDDCFD